MLLNMRNKTKYFIEENPLVELNSEGETLKKAAMDVGIPPEKIILTRMVSNTAGKLLLLKL